MTPLPPKGREAEGVVVKVASNIDFVLG